MVDFVAALQAAGAAIGLVKELNSAAKTYDEALLKLKIAEVSTALATVQIALSEAKTEASRKDEEITRLQASFRQQQDLMEYHGYHYRKGGDGKPQGHPYCPRCMQRGVVIMTVRTLNPGRPEQCPECKSLYQGVATFPYE